MSLFLYALAAAPFRDAQPRAAVMAALPLLAGSGAPWIALGVGAAGAAICARSGYAQVRAFAPWVIAATSLALLLALATHGLRWRIDTRPDAAFAVTVTRQWLWFLWPTWPLVLWTLWRWRQHLGHRHLTVPLVTAVVPLLANLGMDGLDRALMLAVPGFAVLAAFALPTLARSTAAAIDWFSMIFFSVAAIAIWVIYTAFQTGVPAKPAANVARLAPGFSAHFSAVECLLAVVGTLAWVALVRWRTGRHREAVWKSMVLPAGGVALCWLLLMTLWLPLLDYARSARPLVDRLAVHLPPGACVAAPSLRPSAVAAFEYFGRWRVDARADAAAGDCNVMVLTSGERDPPPAPAGWTFVAAEQRPTDRDEVTAVYRRLQ
jgi:hypothetical protein